MEDKTKCQSRNVAAQMAKDDIKLKDYTHEESTRVANAIPLNENKIKNAMQFTYMKV